jgi:hypothetical protein
MAQRALVVRRTFAARRIHARIVQRVTVAEFLAGHLKPLSCAVDVERMLNSRNRIVKHLAKNIFWSSLGRATIGAP